MKIYRLSNNSNLYRNFTRSSLQNPCIISDSDFICEDKPYNIVTDINNLIDFSNKFKGKIEDVNHVHFINGLEFDRDYFRRLYPNIKIHNKPELADVIIYDTSVNQRLKNSCKQFYKTKSNLIYKNEWYFYDVRRTVQRQPNYHYTVMFAPATSIIREIFELNNTDFYVIKNKEYINRINACGKPFILKEELLNHKLAKNLSYEDALTYLKQCLSGDEAMAQTAVDAVLSYDSSVYLPIQILLFSLSPSNNSSKCKLFKSEYGWLAIKINKCRDYIDFLYSFDHICNRIWEQFPNSDWALAKKLVLSQELYKKFQISRGSVTLDSVSVKFNKGVFYDYL